MTRPGSLLHELKRRRVYHVAVAYAVVAWAIIQVSDTVLPRLGLPDWSVTFVVVLSVAGFPIALILSWLYDLTRKGVVRTEANERSAPLARSRVIALVVAVVVVLSAAWLGWRRWGVNGALDPSLIAVFPFRTAGADASLAYLREGMRDLISAKLSGDVGPHAVDPRTVDLALRRGGASTAEDVSSDAALEIARRLSAGQLVLGEVVSLPGRVAVTASLYDVARGRANAPVTQEAPIDSLSSLVDHLVSALLSLRAGEGSRLTSLTTASLPALRLFLEGQSAYRNGRFDAALRNYARAVETDSTFALAALMLDRTTSWASARAAYATRADVRALAWRHRQRLGSRDLAYLSALVGANYPRYTSTRQRIAMWDSLTRALPEVPEVWFEYGDLLAHRGALVDIPDSTARRRAEDAFVRALALDSAYLPARRHLVEMALIREDTAAARRYADQYLALAPAGAEAALLRTQIAAHALDSTALPALLATADSFGSGYHLWVLAWRPTTLPIANQVADYFASRVGDAAEFFQRHGPALYYFDYARGKSDEALRFLDQARRARIVDREYQLTDQIRLALHADVDSAVAARAATELEQYIARVPVEQRSADASCVLGQWWASTGRAARLKPLIDRLAADTTPGEGGEGARRCGELLAAWRALEVNSPDAASLIARLDSVTSEGRTSRESTHEANLILARLLERAGDLRAAFRVLGRFSTFDPDFLPYGATFARERGRVALLLADTAAAVQAYRWYVAARSNPDARLRPELERIRTKLAELLPDARR